jgi:hypothetical protein
MTTRTSVSERLLLASILFLLPACAATDDPAAPDTDATSSDADAGVRASGGNAKAGGAGSSATGGSSGSNGRGGAGGVTNSGGSADSGSSKTGGAKGTGGTAADSGSGGSAGQTSPPQVVGDCSGLAAKGTWEQTTPPEVAAGFGKQQDYGAFAFAVDPVNSGTVYLGTARQKVWKSTDCGSTWTHITTGRNGTVLDPGMNWTFLVDPVETNVVYTNAGYGNGSNGAYRSTNGGVDWDPIWPPQSQPELADVVEYNFANTLVRDPADRKHLLLTFHAKCKAPYTESCIAETTDAGDTWRVTSGDPAMVGGEGQVVYFLDTPHTWLWASQSSGFYRTEDSGKTWARANLPGNKEAHLQGSQILHAPGGAIYLAASDGISATANGKDWTLSFPSTLGGGLVSDGTTMYYSSYYSPNWGTDLHPYFTAPVATGAPWTPMASPGMTSGGTLGYDSGHHLLYSSNLGAGFWRVVVQ